MAITIETIQKRFEQIFQPKMIEVKVSKQAWDELHNRFADASLDGDSNNRLYHLSRMRSALEEAGLKKYYEVNLDEKLADLGPKPEFEQIYKGPSEDGQFMILKFKNAKPAIRH